MQAVEPGVFREIACFACAPCLCWSIADIMLVLRCDDPTDSWSNSLLVSESLGANSVSVNMTICPV